MSDPVVPVLSQPQQTLLAKIVSAGEVGMVVPGALGSTAKVLRSHALVEVVPGDHAPPRQRATNAGREWERADNARAEKRASLVLGSSR